MSEHATARPGFQPGFVVVHGNRIEDLADLVLDWLARHPLGPLDEETLLVPSSGMAEWLKAAMATRHGIAAGFRIELPAQFVWRAWRAVLGEDAVPAASPLDKEPLTWWLMRLLPELVAQARQGQAPEFAPLAEFLEADDAVMRRLELSRRLADLFDQYQVYRPDWLDDWAAGRDRLARVAGDPAAPALPPGQRWQAALWRRLLGELGSPGHAGAWSRPALHQRFVAALKSRPAGSPPVGLPPRLVLFGTTHLPHTTLEALQALSRHLPVLLAVPDPCRQDWAGSAPDAELDHPLLQAWGRQSRDFLRQLQVHDERLARAQQLGLTRTELFDDTPGQTLLQQLQARIRELTPTADPAAPALPGDRSLVFHQAHGPMREVELLHDQLLHAFAHSDLEPRDVVVMVPDIERFAPAITAVFGHFAPGDARHIPWGLADRRERGRHALLRALDSLLQVRERRWAFSELQALLTTPAVAARCGLDEAGVEQVLAWMAGAGACWGLHEAQRSALGLGAAGEVGSLRFALDRLLMGYATGVLPAEADPPLGIDPWPEVAGLAAEQAGALAMLLERLDAWWADAAAPRTAGRWLPRLRELLTSMFLASDDTERSLLALLDDSLQAWVAACEAANFDEPLDLELVREAWLAGVDEAGGGGRFRAGGVTFCTLLPLRAIPFRRVCLLGMNDGEYPRPSSRSDFDLMADPALARPGDRSRRDDDRQLMLDALLAARDTLHISWSAHAARDHQAQPPSVLVAQLRDHVRALWGEPVLQALTVAHPLQPFSRRYHEAGADSRLFTYAQEWRGLHQSEPVGVPAGAPPTPPTAAPARAPTVTLRQLGDFVRNPVKAFFLQRLRADLRLQDDSVDDDEPFVDAGLAAWQWRDDALRTLRPWLEGAGADAAPEAQAQQHRRVVERLAREGRLPWGGPGRASAAALLAELAPALREWSRLRAGWVPAESRIEPLMLAGCTLDPGALPWLQGPAGSAQVLELSAHRLTLGKAEAQKPKLRADKLVAAWLQQLVLAAAGRPAGLWMVGTDVVLRAAPIATPMAQEQLAHLVDAWRDGVGDGGPWPTVLATGLALLADNGRPWEAYGSDGQRRGDDQDPHLARLYPDYASLSSEPRFEAASRALYAPLATWLDGLQSDALADAVAVDGDEEPGDAPR